MRRLRGRPRHNDVLTPREWEVLSLLREGLTNEQIALRLNITFDTAKFHVSEILGKLGVGSRQDAAAWRGQPRGVPVPAAAPTIWQRVGLTSPVRVFAATAIATVAVGMLALAGGLLLMDSRDGEQPPAASVEGHTGDEALDAMIESVLTNDAALLASRFAGVTAREGVVVGGPIGMPQPVTTLSTVEWTARMASSNRALYSVAQNPVEPFPWYQSPAPSIPRASVFAGPRDYDVLFIVTEQGLAPTPWRMSILDGSVVDIVVDKVVPQGSPPQPGQTRELILRIANLVPSFDTQRSTFLVAPPEDRWPPPVQGAGVSQGGPNPPGPAGVSSPAYAPGGRTGLPKVDDDIDALLSQKAGDLRKTFSHIAGREEACEFIGGPYCASIDSRVPLDEWTDRLANGKRTLYSVSTFTSEHIAIVIAVDSGGDAAEAWRFISWNGEITELSIYLPLPLSQFGGSVSPSEYFWSRVRGATPQPDNDYERFFVLPPRDLLPQVPAGYDSSVRTGDTDVDALLALVASKNVGGLAGALLAPSETLFRICGNDGELRSSTEIQAWAQGVLPTVVNLASVVTLPAGYQPQAEHLLVFRTEVSPLLWSGFGLLEKDSRIVGVLDAERGCEVEAMYPPAKYIVPPSATSADLDQSRRSGLPVVDALLDAASAGDEVRVDSLISYGTPCGYEYAPACPAGVSSGTLVEGLTVTYCHGGYETRADAPQAVIELVESAALYGIAEPEKTLRNPEGHLAVVLHRGDPNPGGVTLLFDMTGLTAIRHNCGGPGLHWMPSGTPNFLLPPK